MDEKVIHFNTKVCTKSVNNFCIKTIHSIFCHQYKIAFTVLGAFLLYFSGQPKTGLDAGLPARLVYNLDQLLPIVEFERYDNVVLTGGVAYYFYLQKLVGWVLGSFLVPGLAGLTQKQ